MTSQTPHNSPPYLSQETFTQACAALPLVSVDLMITRPASQGREVLLGLRNNRPAQDWWFTPGGRIRKNEPLALALQRIATEELGLPIEHLQHAYLLGAWDHFYPDSAFDATISTHYVNLPHALHLSAAEAEILQPPCGAQAQHKAWQWLSLAEAEVRTSVHPYVRQVMQLLHPR